jgi:hypothetical protein
MSPTLSAGQRILGIVLALSAGLAQPAAAAAEAVAPLPAQASAPVSASARNAARQLVQLRNADTMSQQRLDAARDIADNVIVQQELRALPQARQLSPEALRKLALRIEHDIRPVVAQAFAQVDRRALSTSLTDLYARELTSAQANTLLTYYRSAAGRQYMAFSRELDGLLGDGLRSFGTQAFSFSRPTDSAAAQQRRDALIDMSSTARQLRAAQAAGGHHASAAEGLVKDLIAGKYGKQLDALAARHAGQLQGFAQFQHSDAARAEDRVFWLWGRELTARLAPTIEQARTALAAKRPAWLEQARTAASGGAATE